MWLCKMSYMTTTVESAALRRNESYIRTEMDRCYYYFVLIWHVSLHKLSILRTDVQSVSPIALVFDFEHFITISDILL